MKSAFSDQFIVDAFTIFLVDFKLLTLKYNDLCSYRRRHVLSSPGTTIDEWEAELQRELNEFELVDGANGVKEGDADAAGGPEGGEEDDALEREIMEQL